MIESDSALINPKIHPEIRPTNPLSLSLREQETTQMPVNKGFVPNQETKKARRNRAQAPPRGVEPRLPD